MKQKKKDTSRKERGEKKGMLNISHYITGCSKSCYSSQKKIIKHILETSEKTILDLATKIAGKIIATKIEDDKEYFLSLVKKALKEVKNFPEVQIACTSKSI